MRLIKGNNGGLFYFSTNSWDDWKKSLEFYKGVTYKARFKRLLLYWAYHIVGEKRSRSEMADKVEEATGCRPDVSHPCSAIVAPTGDKAVVHIHDVGYWKSAGGQSYSKVKGEVEVYRLLAAQKTFKFGYSTIIDIRDDGKHISFFMPEEKDTFYGDVVKPLADVLPALEEFHAVTGLVHGDFKPWNVRWRKDGRPHFFDFEECHLGDIQEDIEFYRSLGGLKK